MIDKALLEELFIYDEQRGSLLWKVKQSNRVLAGSTAGSVDQDGYVIIKIKGKRYRRSRLVWILFNDVISDKKLEVDHKNRIRYDDRIDNLRLVSKKLNQENRKVNCNNLSGIKGVYFNKQNKKWVAKITHNSIHYHLGSFNTMQEAINARVIKEQELFTPI